MSNEEPKVTRAQFAREKGEIALRDHEYDGIQEYDQLLPNWWLFIFFAFTAFFFAYWIVYYQFGLTRTDVERLDDRLAVIREARASALADLLANLDNESLVNQLATDPGQLALGESVYSQHCVACHGQDLHARMVIGDDQFINLPGLSLMDADWKYGAEPMDIFRIINEGTPADSEGHNGARMLAYGDLLPPTDIAAVTAYIIAQNPEEFQVPEPTGP